MSPNEDFRKQLLEAIRYLRDDLEMMKDGCYHDELLNIMMFGFEYFGYDGINDFNRGLQRLRPGYNLHAEINLIQERLKDDRYSRASDIKRIKTILNLLKDLELLIPKYENHTPQTNKNLLEITSNKVVLGFGDCDKEGFE